MTVIRVQKNRNYTCVSNVHLRDKTISLKAKGLLTVMLSLPDNWNYSIPGLASINKEGISAIKTALKELKEAGYVVVNKTANDETGQFEYEYCVYENPVEQNLRSNPEGGFPPMVNPPLETEPLINTEVRSTEILSTEIDKKKNIKKKKSTKHEYGDFKNVLLTDDEYSKLKAKFSDLDSRIQKLSYYIESKGAKYKSHYATILAWARKDKEQNDKKLQPASIPHEFQGYDFNEREAVNGVELADVIEKAKEGLVA